MKKIFAIALLSLGLAACEPNSTDNPNANSNARATDSPVAATAAPGASVKPEVKAGDKVKVTIGGTAAEATVVSVDEKAGKAAVKIQGQKEERTVAIADIVKK